MNGETEATPEKELALDRSAIVSYLKGLDVDVELEDWEGENDDDVIGNIAGLALEHGLDVDEVYAEFGIQVEESDEQE